MVMEQTAFKLNAIRCQSNRIASRRKRKGFEIATDQKVDGIGRCHIHGGFAYNGIGKRENTAAGSNDCTAVSDLKINGSVTLDGKDLNGGRKLIEFSELNVSAHQNLHAFLCQRDLGKLADRSLVILDQLFAGDVEFRFEDLIEMLRKITYGKLGNTRSADMRKRSRLRTVTQSHHADLAVCVSGARILTVGQIVSRRIFAILRDYPISIHVFLPIS